MLQRHWPGQPFDASIQLIDSVIQYDAAHQQNVAIAMIGTGPGRSFYLNNSYVSNAARIWHAGPETKSSWRRYEHLAVHIRPEARDWGQPAEPIYIDGQVHGDFYEISSAGEPPADLQARHQWPACFPTWQSPGAVNVRDLGARGDGSSDDWQILQRAIHTHETLFFPPGIYMVSKPLDLRPESKLIGGYHEFTSIQAISSLQNRFGGTAPTDPDLPIIRTPDTDYHPPYLFRFVNCDDFLIAGIADTITTATRWIGGPYDRWIHADFRSWHPIQDTHPRRDDVVVPSAHRPILYLRGQP